MSNKDYTEGLGKKQVTRQKAQNKKGGTSADILPASLLDPTHSYRCGA
jgi:hypothetical protein